VDAVFSDDSRCRALTRNQSQSKSPRRPLAWLKELSDNSVDWMTKCISSSQMAVRTLTPEKRSKVERSNDVPPYQLRLGTNHFKLSVLIEP
jgi:hypothetical protein